MPGGRKEVTCGACYAPTRAASREDKETLFQVLDGLISSVPAQESYFILGDFNACVGSRENVDEVWSAARGPESSNDAGR